MVKTSAEIPTLLDAEEAFESGDVETALAIAEGLLGEDEASTPVEVLYLAAECLLELQEAQEAGHLLEVALGKAPDDPVLIHAKGICLFEMARLAEAREAFQRAADLHADLGEARFYLAILAERDGKLEEASRRYAEAVERDPENLVVPRDWPVDVIAQAFDEIVEEMPDPLGVWLASLQLSVEDLPGGDLLNRRDGPVSPLILCFFEGTSPGEPEGEDPDEWLLARPDKVRLFRLNFGKSAHDTYELHREMLEALLWESVEFLGLDDSHLAVLGLLTDTDDEDLHHGPV